MFFCVECKNKNEWPESMATSYGTCEVCGKRAYCFDVPSKVLPSKRVLCHHCERYIPEGKIKVIDGDFKYCLHCAKKIALAIIEDDKQCDTDSIIEGFVFPDDLFPTLKPKKE